MMFSHQLNQLSEDLEETRSEDEKVTEKVDESTVTELNAEVSGPSISRQSTGEGHCRLF